MNLTEREKKVFKDLLNRATITEDELIEAGYFETEVKEIKSDRERKCMYKTSDEECVRRIFAIINDVLGDDWKYKYDHTEEKRNSKYYLYISLTEKEFDEICKAAESRKEK